MPEIALWDDNPSSIDLLGFDAVVAPVLEAVNSPNLDPVTIGIHGPWGLGKSTILGLLDTALSVDPRHLIVRTNPWEYDDYKDVKGTLIAEVLGALTQRFGATGTIAEKAKGLLKRISWSRVGIALANGAVRLQWNPDELIEAFTPRAKETPESMTGFRDAFEEFLTSLPDLDRVVVLVDDLDRCLPEAVTSTFEAIKLFLSVPKMVFVIAADQDMVRDAIAISVDSGSRGERFAARYLEKIIQLPVSLPRLSPHEAEAYTALLIARAECETDQQYAALVAHCSERRRSHVIPFVGGLEGLEWKPSPESLLLAAQFAQGLGADRVSSPRQIKRFLNAFGVRQHIAKARGIDISPAVIGKILLLEDGFRDDFERLAASPPAERAALLAQWESWAKGEEETIRPEGVSEASRRWAASDPLLANVEIGPYITLAATLSLKSFGADLSDEIARLVERLMGPSQADRGLAQAELAERSVAEQREAVGALLARARRLDDVSEIVDALIAVASSTPELVDEIVQGIRADCWTRLEPASVALFAASNIEEVVALVNQLAMDETIEADVREAAITLRNT
jgi:hypothetical protein